jgi:hypothetical protein
VLSTHEDARKDGVVVPKTLAEYCDIAKPIPRPQSHCYDDCDFFNEEDYPDGEDEDEDEDDDEEDEDDSGHGDL